MLLFASVAVTGCSTDTPAPPPAPDSSQELPDFHSDGDASSSPPAVELVWNVDEKKKVAALAAETMRLFARPDITAEAWWADLEPLLSAQARHDYVGVDPRSVPVRRVTGPVRLVAMDTDLVSIAHVPTDAGLYAITLSRSPQEPSWVVERIAPPETDPHAKRHK